MRNNHWFNAHHHTKAPTNIPDGCCLVDCLQSIRVDIDFAHNNEHTESFAVDLLGNF